MSVPAQPVQRPARIRAGLRLLWGLPQQTLILLLKAYRRLVSPLYGQVCRFFPSCSAYALEAVTVHGAVRGTCLAARRLARCHPWNDGGVDHVPASARYERMLRENPARTPRILVLNHPVIPSDEEGRPAA
ncbi:membrane protein insertion efficiency factor YidD [Arthrobacter sp. GCM10027362]|uniref:membrane protein insertion efficiency factor YidD n=1 Tax=Arthrobacter sp. GCM10027362 TaxID=3273379 RepID=UPI00362D1956